MAKTIKIGGRIESTETGNVVACTNAILDDTKGKKQNVINGEVDAELTRLQNEKQNNLTFDSAPTEDSTNPVTSGGVYTATLTLQQAIEAILLLIPSAATALNKLADRAFVNSSIATSTATFRGTYTSVAALDNVEGDANDYAYVSSTDAQGNSTYDRYKYVEGTGWVFEYKLNNNAFTADEWAAIQSGITAALVSKLSGLPNATELEVLLNGKQNVLTFDDAPASGSNNPVKSGGVYTAIGNEAMARGDADTLLDGKIGDEKTARENADLLLQQGINGVAGDVTAIQGKIPSGASSSNKLVDSASMTAAIASVIEALDASYTVTTPDNHVSVTLTQVDGKVTAFNVTTNDIASAQAVGTLMTRVTTAEGDITLLNGRVSTNESDIANLQQLYNNLQQSKPEPVTELPSSGQQQGVIYRLAGSISYSDYMWDGSSWVLMATYNNAIDDVPVKYSDNLVKSAGLADLNYLLNDYPEIEVGKINGYYMKANGSFQALAGYYVNYFFAKAGEIVRVHSAYLGAAPTFANYALFTDVPTSSSTPSYVNGEASDVHDGYIYVNMPYDGYIAVIGHSQNPNEVVKYQKVIDLTKEQVDYTRVFALEAESGTVAITGYYLNNSYGYTALSAYSVKYWPIAKGETIKMSYIMGNSVLACCGIYKEIPTLNNSAYTLYKGTDTLPADGVFTSPIDGYFVSSQASNNPELKIFRQKTVNEVKEDIAEIIGNRPYFGKTCLYIGDSVSTGNNFYWKGLIEDGYNLKYVRANTGPTGPADGGIRLVPPVNENADKPSIWYRCAQNRMSAYDFDMISLYGGYNDLYDRDTLVLGTKDDIAYVDDATGFSSDVATDVRPETLTFCSALKGCILMLQRDFPNKEIVIPTVMTCTDGLGTWIPEGETLTATELMAILQLQVAQLYGLKCIPMFWDMRRENSVKGVFAGDAIHPNYQGALRLRALFAQTLPLK